MIVFNKEGKAINGCLSLSEAREFCKKNEGKGYWFVNPCMQYATDQNGNFVGYYEKETPCETKPKK